MTKSDVTHITRRDLLRTAGTGFGMVALSQLLAEDRPAGGPLAADDFGFKAVEDAVHPNDLHATILRLMGFDHTRLTYRHSGRGFPPHQRRG